MNEWKGKNRTVEKEPDEWKKKTGSLKNLMKGREKPDY
jgi:hypothetical protein